MSDEDAVRDHLNAAYQYARLLNKPMLSYLIEMAILESEEVDTGAKDNGVPTIGQTADGCSAANGKNWF